MQILVDRKNIVRFITDGLFIETQNTIIAFDSSNNRIYEVSKDIIGYFTIYTIDYLPEDFIEDGYYFIDNIFSKITDGDVSFLSTNNIYSRIDFLNLLNSDERYLFRISDNKLISDFRYLVEMSDTVSLDDTKVQEAMYYMFLNSIFSEERLNYIFSKVETFWK